MLNGINIDDPKGVFVLRWYKEVDKAGKELSGFQNKECAGYKLTHDNCGEPFCSLLDQQRAAHQQGLPQEAHEPDAHLRP